jgi:hypothetical protein
VDVATVPAAPMVDVAGMEDVIVIEDFAVDAASLALVMEDETFAVADAATIVPKTPNGETGAHNATGVYPGIGSVTPNPSTAQSGFAAGVYPAGGEVNVIVVVKVVRLGPVDSRAQYSVPYTFLHSLWRVLIKRLHRCKFCSYDD